MTNSGYHCTMKFNQLPHTLLMVKPGHFGFNEQTASTNFFQQNDSSDLQQISDQALAEFDLMIETLHAHDVKVIVFHDAGVVKPDAIFPNNWISTHEDGKIILYSLYAQNRRLERSNEILDLLKNSFSVEEIIDLSEFEASGKFLEGTASLVFDHTQKIVYASLSPRTELSLVTMLATKLGYKAICFNAVDERGIPVYHTDVILSIGSNFAIVCLDAIHNEREQEIVIDNLNASGRKIIAISYEQMKSFAGNVLEVFTNGLQPVVLMSQRAIKSLLKGQISAISEFAEILTMKIDTIEKYGGGSVRCMIAGIHLPKRK
jgi:hypothetical protein